MDQKTGGFGEKVQEFLFVKEDELERADKTKVALVSLSCFWSCSFLNET